MHKNYIPFLSFVFYTQRFVFSHHYTSHRMGFSKSGNVRITLRKYRSCAACHPGVSENMHVQLIWCQFAPGWEFHTGQDRWGEFTPGQILFQFLVVNNGRCLTTHTVELNLEQNFSCKQALVHGRGCLFEYVF